MTIARFLLGVALAGASLGPIAYGARSVRRRMLPGWSGLDATLVDVLLAVTGAVVVCEALGTVGQFRTAPVVVALAVVGLGAHLGLRARDGATAPDAPASAAPPDPEPKGHRMLAGMVVAVVAGSWTSRTVRAFDRGMESVDTLWYHLPVAARFVQSGHLDRVQYLDPDPVTAFYPATSSVLHAIGMLWFGSDVASPLLNLGWLAVALAAAWSIGRRFGVASVTTCGAALLFATPGLVATQPGGGYTDAMGLALLLVAGALLVAGHDAATVRPLGQDVAVALAIGLSIGTKFTFVGPGALMALALLATAPWRIWARRIPAIVATVLVAGGYWYGRNLLVAGNPLPSLDLSLGPISLPSVQGSIPTASVADHLFEQAQWRRYFIPGFGSSLGPAWPALLAIVAVGLVVAMVGRRPPVVRWLAIVGVLSLGLYLVTPQYLDVLGLPFFFVYNLRYATPGLVLGLVVLPVAWPRARLPLLLAYGLAVAVTQLDPTSWPTGFGWAVFQDRSAGADAAWGLVAAAVLAVAWWIRIARPDRLTTRSLAVASVVVVVAGLAVVRGPYLDRRYRHTEPFPSTFNWARNLHGQRVLVGGLLLQEQYPFYGVDRSNTVQYAGIRRSDGGFRAVASCAEWARLLHDGRYRYVVLTPSTPTTEAPQEALWTEAQPGARLVRREDVDFRTLLLTGRLRVRVYEVDPDAAPAPC